MKLTVFARIEARKRIKQLDEVGNGEDAMKYAARIGNFEFAINLAEKYYDQSKTSQEKALFQDYASIYKLEKAHKDKASRRETKKIKYRKSSLLDKSPLQRKEIVESAKKSVREYKCLLERVL